MNWNEKTKEEIAYIFAFIAFLVGFGLVISGFVVEPTGEVHSSVQWILGECLVFVAAVLGISLHVKNELNNLKDTLHKHIEDKIDERFNEDN